jgi:hypothetical protein
MVKGFKFAAVPAILLLQFTYPQSALAWNALSYQQAVLLCGMGDVRGCAVMRAYQDAARGGSPADQWVSPPEVQQQRPGALSRWDLIGEPGRRRRAAFKARQVNVRGGPASKRALSPCIASGINRPTRHSFNPHSPSHQPGVTAPNRPATAASLNVEAYLPLSQFGRIHLGTSAQVY